MANMLDSKRKTAAPPTLAPPSMTADIDRALSQLSTAFNPLHQEFALDFHVSGARDGYVFLSIALPEGMTRVFVQLLESLHGFFRCLDIKARSAIAERKALDPRELSRAKEVRAAFDEKVCSVFDDLRGQGLDVKEAISRTNLALKAQKHPWATYEAVVNVLRAAGRFRKTPRRSPSKGESA